MYYLDLPFFHCIALHFLSCIVLFCCTVHYCLFSFLIFSLLATSSMKLTLNLNAQISFEAGLSSADTYNLAMAFSTFWAVTVAEMLSSRYWWRWHLVVTVCRRLMEHPATLDMFIYTKYLLAANAVSKLLPDAWHQLVLVTLLLPVMRFVINSPLCNNNYYCLPSLQFRKIYF